MDENLERQDDFFGPQKNGCEAAYSPVLPRFGRHDRHRDEAVQKGLPDESAGEKR